METCFTSKRHELAVSERTFTLGFEVVNGWYIISQYVNKDQYVNDEGKEVVNTGYTLHGTTSMSGCQSIFPCGTSLLYTQQLGLEAPEYAGV